MNPAGVSSGPGTPRKELFGELFDFTFSAWALFARTPEIELDPEEKSVLADRFAKASKQLDGNAIAGKVMAKLDQYVPLLAAGGALVFIVLAKIQLLKEKRAYVRAQAIEEVTRDRTPRQTREPPASGSPPSPGDAHNGSPEGSAGNAGRPRPNVRRLFGEG